MKNLILITTVLFLLVKSNGYSQTNNPEIIYTKQDTILKKQDTKTEFDTKKFIGKYFLAEADFTLEIVEEDNKMYIISPFSKDILIATNDSTLHELVRGVDLELIKDNKDALKFTQNGYETIIKRVIPKTENK